VEVVVGLTVSVPPVGAISKLLPSVPVRITLVASVATTVNVVEEPAAMGFGLAVRVTVGAGGGGAGTTVTVAVAVAVAVPLLAVTVYVVVARGVTICVPPVALMV
jgi:hypothetical protein